MSQSQASLTSPTLIGLLQQNPPDKDAWSRFVWLYGPRIKAWCLQQGLNDTDTEDVMQEFLIKLLRAIQNFRYDPQQSFRGWLFTCVKNAVNTFKQSRKSRVTSIPDPVLESLEDPKDFYERIAEVFDLEVYQMAREEVRTRVEQRTWEIYRLLYEPRFLSGCQDEQRTPSQVAEQMGIPCSAVYNAKKRVKELLTDHISRLEGNASEV
jgi:RNA polymerase sigma-70 factor (ECF subfamily)